MSPDFRVLNAGLGMRGVAFSAFRRAKSDAMAEIIFRESKTLSTNLRETSRFGSVSTQKSP
jgi:hypothetical protein